MFAPTRRERFDYIAQRIARAGGIHEVTLETLRDAYGAARTGCHIRNGIARELKQRSIEFLPRQLPTDQTHVVTLFHTGMPAGRVLEGALEFARLSGADKEKAAA